MKFYVIIITCANNGWFFISYKCLLHRSSYLLMDTVGVLVIVLSTYVRVMFNKIVVNLWCLNFLYHSQ